MFRKTVLATAIVGAGLGSMSGAAFAGDAPSSTSHSSDSSDSGHHHSHHGSQAHAASSTCTNNVDAVNEASGGSLADVAGGAQTVVPVNLCDLVSGNKVLNDNHLSVLSQQLF